jgi:hypothetical protein
VTGEMALVSPVTEVQSVNSLPVGIVSHEVSGSKFLSVQALAVSKTLVGLTLKLPILLLNTSVNDWECGSLMVTSEIFVQSRIGFRAKVSES